MASTEDEARGELQLWWTGDTDSIFTYYVTGAMTLSFLITMAITRSLRREEPRVLELLHADNLREMMVTYLLSITTSLTKGSSCGDKVKVFVQLHGAGDRRSQFFQLRSHATGGRPMLKRGHTDIFLLKVPVSLGDITGAKLVLSGAERSPSWRVTGVQLYEPHKKRRHNLHTTVHATEVIGHGNVTDKVIVTSRPCAEWFLHVCVYHQWLSGYVNTVRFGAFTEIVHVIFTFFTLYTLMMFTQLAYILLPGGALKDNFELNIASLFIGSLTSSIYSSLLSLGFELLIRQAKSVEKKIGSAYKTVINENICAKEMAPPVQTSYSNRNQSAAVEQGNFWMTFVMSLDDFETRRPASMSCTSNVNGVNREMPTYLAKLLSFIDQEEERLAELERQRRLDRGHSMLSLTNSSRVRESQVSFLGSIQSLSKCEINLPRFSQICLDRMLSGRSSMGVKIVDDDWEDYFTKPPTKSYMELLVAKLEKRCPPVEAGVTESVSETVSEDLQHVLLDLSGQNFDYLTHDSNTSLDHEDPTVRKIATTTTTSKQPSKEPGKETFTIVLAESSDSASTIAIDFPPAKVIRPQGKDGSSNQPAEELTRPQGKSESSDQQDEELIKTQEESWFGSVAPPEVAVNIEADEQHVVSIDDINIEGDTLAAAAARALPEVKIDVGNGRDEGRGFGADVAEREDSREDSRAWHMKTRSGREWGSRMVGVGEDAGARNVGEGARVRRESQNVAEESQLRRRNLSHPKSPGRSSHSDDPNHTAAKVEDETCKSDGFPEVKYSSTSVRSITPFVWQEWQKTQKVWCRKLVQAVHESFKASRSDLMQGILVTADIDLVMLEWAHEVVKQISIACSLRRVTFEKELLKYPHIMHLFSHLSAEIIFLVVNDVFACLRSSEFVTLAELVLQSHHVMAAVEHATDCITYIINTGDMDAYTPFRYLDMGQDLVDIRDRFIQMSFELTVTFTDITWAFFLALLRNEDRTQTLSDTSLERLQDYVESQLSWETEEDVIVKKLCHAAEQEAKHDVWLEFHSQTRLFSSVLIKQQTLKQFNTIIAASRRKKNKFDQTHDLIPEVPKTRIEKLVEKRHVNLDKVKEKAKAATKPKPTEAEIKESKRVSEWMSRHTETLVYLWESVKNKWKREGLSTEIPGATYLTQALIHPGGGGGGDGGEGPADYSFDNFLHLKRTESFVQLYLEHLVLGMAELLLTDMLDMHDLGSDKLADKDKDFIVNEILVKVDAAGVVLVRDVQDFARDIVAREPDSSVDPDSLRRSSKMLVDDSIPHMMDFEYSHTNLDTNFNAIPDSNKRRGPSPASLGHRVSFSDAGMAESEASWTTAREAADSSDKEGGEVGDDSSNVSGQQSIFQELINDLKPLKTYLEMMQKTESLRREATKKSHLERSREKREYQLSVCLNNVIDSYYLIHEGDDSHTFTRAALYQLEHDLVGESSRPLPAFVKTAVVWTMMIMILGSLVYVSVAGGQFSTTQVQEWTCFYLFSVLMFGFGLEPVRAMILGRVFGDLM